MSAQDTFFSKNKTLICRGKVLSLNTPAVMGILNVTPDSFFDGGKYSNEKSVVEQAAKMISEGAGIVDIGACSTRPGAEAISEKLEIERLLPAIRWVRQQYKNILISADTFRANVAREAVKAGADMINDVSGGTLDDDMFSVVGELNVPYVLMHIKGKPLEMQNDPQYSDVNAEVSDYFKRRIELAVSKKIGQIILDPGFGFGKTLEHNYQLLQKLSSIKSFGFPIMIGASRKSMINKVLGTAAKEALNGTTVVNTIALLNGADILRVHDVKQACEAVKVYETYKSSAQKN